MLNKRPKNAMNESKADEGSIATEPVRTKILIIRLSSIGDIVLTTPVIRCVKQQLPNAEVHFLVKHAFRMVVESNPYIDKLHLLHDRLSDTIETLKREKFDYIIDLHHNLRTAKIKSALKVKAFSFNKLNLQKWLLTATKINTLPNIHIVDRYMETVATLGVRNDGKGLDYFLAHHDAVPDDHIPHSHYFGYVALVIGAAHHTKKLPVNKLQEFCKAVDYPIILLGGPDDRREGDAIASIDTVKIYNSCGKFKLNESADLIRRSKLVVTHDTGLMHMAAAFKKPIISIWGNTVPAFGMTPYFGYASQPDDRMEVKGLWCRPCSKIGYNKCPLGHFNCMNKQDIQELVLRAMAKTK